MDARQSFGKPYWLVNKLKDKKGRKNAALNAKTIFLKCSGEVIDEA